MSLNSLIFLLSIVAIAVGLHAEPEEQRLSCSYYDKKNLFSVSPQGDLGESIFVLGDKQDGFLKVGKMYGKVRRLMGITYDQTNYEATHDEATRFCQNGLENTFPERAQLMRLLKITVKSSLLSINSSTPIFPDFRKIDRIVAFGDSLTDPGNLKRKLIIHPRSPYFPGHFSDGLVWIEYMGMVSQLPIQNWAVGGSVSMQYFDINLNNKKFSDYLRINLISAVSSSVKNQIDRYHQQALNGQMLTKPESTLFTLWIGGNDYLDLVNSEDDVDTFIDNPNNPRFGYKTVVRRITSNIISNLSRLYKVGARNFTVGNLPDLGITPFIQKVTSYHRGRADSAEKKIFALSTALHEISILHNQTLKEMLADFKNEHPDAAIVYFDAYKSVSDALLNQEQYGYDFDASLKTTIKSGSRSVTLINSCLDTSWTGRQKVCLYPERAFFWDIIHPSNYGHCLLANQMHSTLAKSGMLKQASLDDYLRICRPDLVD